MQTLPLLLQTRLSKTFTQVGRDGEHFYFTPSEGTSLLITEVDPLTAILCRAEHTSQGLSPQLSSEDPRIFSSRINGLLWLLKELRFISGTASRLELLGTIPGVLASEEVLTAHSLSAFGGQLRLHLRS